MCVFFLSNFALSSSNTKWHRLKIGNIKKVETMPILLVPLAQSFRQRTGSISHSRSVQRVSAFWTGSTTLIGNVFFSFFTIEGPFRQEAKDLIFFILESVKQCISPLALSFSL